MFRKAQREAAVKATFIVLADIAKSAWPFNEVEFVKKCVFKVCVPFSHNVNITTEMRLSWNKLVGLTTGRNVRSKEWTGGQDSGEDAGEQCR